MKFRRNKQTNYIEPTANDILRAYINKNAGYNRAEARRIKRQLRKLAYF